MQNTNTHQEKVAALSTRMKEFYEKGTKVRIYHGSTNSTRAQKFDPERTIDASDLDQVLEINTAEGYAIVEPNVPMDALVKATLKHFVIPPVIMEFPGITVGGGIQGGAGESSSFREGLFHECCLEYEMVLGNGDVVTASRENHTDLFFGTACSYGTLGVITRVKLRVIPATKYVRLRYLRVSSFAESVDVLGREMRSNNDFVDGILFSEKCGAIITGERTNEAKGKVVTFSKASDQWFYLHAQKITEQHPVYEETVPLDEYLFRYDRGGFWVAPYGFKRWSVPFNRFTRFIFNPFLKTRELYDVLHATNVSQEFFVQDISLPEKGTLAFLDFIHEHINVYPLWLCPLRPDNNTRLSPEHLNTEMIINVGVWGITTKKHGYDELHALNREVENLTEKLGGRKILYAHAYYPRDEFWKIYDAEWYQSLREKYHATRTFPDMYEKVFVGEKYRAGIGQGVFNLFLRKTKQQLGFAKHILTVGTDVARTQ